MSSTDSSGVNATTGGGAAAAAVDRPSSPLVQSGDATTSPSIAGQQPVGTSATTIPVQGGGGNGLGTVAPEEEQDGGDDDDGEDQPCQACGVFPAKFQCSACHSVRYCSQECQASDWKIHYRECAEIVAAMKEEQEGGVSGGQTLRPRSRSSIPRQQQTGEVAGQGTEGGNALTAAGNALMTIRKETIV